eukprot:gnl/MRDRNA2_/MRDRNA2_67247_c0_seq1.p1 gnl/MRDRNA2_/MRDRNA2_67247_c0~~gnl/MRDRNA2_/MRDRNA2_67247_c0_seq1.p1  ORF type:complete len:145 (+),score=29.15 gnl/MRDRNA2_/MRDRNA2_67247_c0_seq1:373-807(+)
MTGWAKDQGTTGSMLKLLGDPRSEFTKALGVVLDHPGPMAVLGNPRCKRFSMLVDDCVIKSLNVAEGPEDPAGDAKPEVSMVDKMLTDLKGPAAEELFAQEDDMVNVIIALLVGFFAGSGITLMMHIMFHRGTLTAKRKPLLAA